MNIANKYRPGAINVQVNGIQIEDLYQNWAARTKECAELREKEQKMSAMLREQGRLIKELKEQLRKDEVK